MSLNGTSGFQAKEQLKGDPGSAAWDTHAEGVLTIMFTETTASFVVDHTKCEETVDLLN